MRIGPVTIRWQDSRDRIPYVLSNTLPVRSVTMLQKAMGWIQKPILMGDRIHHFERIEDLNDRRLRDAEVIGTVCANHPAKNIVEIGTAGGQTTALIATNAPNSIVYTVNIPPEEIKSGGRHTTYAPTREEIGYAYRELGLQNVRQILANTAHWKPAMESIEIAFVDGCHDTDFVYNDTKKLLELMPAGSIVMWHDFAPELASIYPWIADVCSGIDRLFRERVIRGRILHVQDSWIGLYRVCR